MRLAFLASHNGSAAHAIAKACLDHTIPATPILLVTNNTYAPAKEWARMLGLHGIVVNAKTSNDPDRAIADLLKENAIDLLLCSGYMKKIGHQTIAAMHGKIINIHPALLPRHGGEGMYGQRVHQAVYDAKEKETGITIHLVDDEYDRGRILAQKIIPLAQGATAEDIESTVKAAEPDFYIETLKRILSKEIEI